MRLVHQDPTTGRLKLRLETPSDLWRIARIISVGDLVGASTTRRDPEAPEDAPAAQRERRRIFLTLRAEQVEFHGFSRHVRVTGPIVEGPFDLGRHHTLDLGQGDDLTVQKERLTSAERAILEEGIEARGDPIILLASVDWGESSIVRLRGRAVESVADVRRSVSGKRYKGGQAEKDRASYADELLALLRPEVGNATTIVISGPGFLKEEIGRKLAELEPGSRGKLRILPTAESGRIGVNELLRSGKASEALAGSVAAEEADLVERLVTELAGGRRAAVGIAEVGEATDAGAAETLLVAESLLTDPVAAPVLEGARGARARIFVVREDGEAGQRLKGMGKIGALLRYDWTPTRNPRTVRGSPGPLPGGPRTDA